MPRLSHRRAHSRQRLRTGNAGHHGPWRCLRRNGLILNAPRAASVEAVDQVTVLVLDKKTMDEGLGIYEWMGSLVRALAQRFRALEHQMRASGIRRG